MVFSNLPKVFKVGNILDDLNDIQDDWSAKVQEIESVTVGLEKTDITIDDVALIWIPVDWKICSKSHQGST